LWKDFCQPLYMKNLFALFYFLISSCQAPNSEDVTIEPLQDSVKATSISTAATLQPVTGQEINTGNTTPTELLSYSHTLIGTPYKYGSADPAVGFDCSGFITYVFNHFNIAVPRSSVDFTNITREVSIEEAKPGDLVLFTGTDSTIRDVGHMGIISSLSNNEVNFIHSTSGKAHGVTITPLNKYYMKRFVKVIRVFKANE
jgi:cell wall-associated NlpC family hydrolase